MLVEGWSFKTLMQPFIWWGEQERLRAAWGCPPSSPSSSSLHGEDKLPTGPTQRDPHRGHQR